jgi:hypothetical protein
MRKMLFVLLAGIIFWGCQKDNENNSSTTIKYEVVTTANIKTPPSGLYSYVQYFGSDGNSKEERNVMTSKTWTKSITLNITNRPVGIGFSGQIWTSGPGSITSRVYVNNELRDTRTSQINNSGSVYAGFWANTYTLY